MRLSVCIIALCAIYFTSNATPPGSGLKIPENKYKSFSKNQSPDFGLGDTVVPTPVSCNNWLKIPGALSGVDLGDFNIIGEKITIEAMYNATGDSSETLVSRANMGLGGYRLGSNFAEIQTTEGVGFTRIETPCGFEKNKTYHIAMVLENDTLKLYRNGYLMATGAAYGSLLSGSGRTTIGARAEPSINAGELTLPFKGLINEVRFWNIARTQAELTTYMNTGLPDPATQTGLVAYYRFDDLINKQGNSTLNGTLAGGATINQTNPNCDFVADACETFFSTCSNWLKIPSGSAGVLVDNGSIIFDLVDSHELTIEAMFNSTGSNPMTIISNLGSSPRSRGSGYALSSNSATIETLGGSFSTPVICGFEKNKTYHVAMVYNGTTLKFYRNGFLMSQTEAGGTFTGGVPLANIIGNSSGPSEGFINEVRFWDVARTQAAIKANMNASLPSPATQPGLVAYYIFDDLINKEGSPFKDGALVGGATINQVNPNCEFVADSCDAPVSTCNNWLKIPGGLSGVDLGDFNITGEKITIEAMYNATGDSSETLVSRANMGLGGYRLGSNFAEIQTTGGVGFTRIETPCGFEKNKTYHIAMVLENDTLKLYRNGYLMATGAAYGSLLSGSGRTTIGVRAEPLINAGEPTLPFKGLINEVRFWNIARTQAELTTYMNTGLPDPATLTGLVAYYRFDDLINKQGNSTLNGTLAGGATINQPNPNCDFVADACETFFSTCDSWLKITPGSSPGVDIGDIWLSVPQTAITIEAMVNATDTTPLTVVSSFNDSRFFKSGYALGSNFAIIQTQDGTFYTQTPCGFEKNKTYHIAMVYDGTTLKLYRNGILMSQTPTFGSFTGQNAWNLIGAGSATSAGFINEVRFWDVARSQAEINTYMNASLPSPATLPGLRAYYIFDDLINKEGTSYLNGTLVGGATINQANPNCEFVADSCSNSSGVICPGSNTSFTTDVNGNTYQWQADNGNGNFTNLTNTAPYSNVTTATLSFTAPATALYGYKYRCVVNGNTYSKIFTLKFLNTWTGAQSTAWETAGNWSCGCIPDANTDVYVGTGLTNFPFLNSTPFG